jgi:prepilin-type N-terminal cleavage/methylation domain-containing protein
MHGRQNGFTLIEIAIVLVIIGLLLGGVLKGQELITGARVRNLVSQQDGVKAAYFGFLDRYRALPGDYTQATANIANVTGGALAACNNGNGDGDGQIETAGNEFLLVWEHLARAGFINGNYMCAAAESGATSPSNPYGGFMNLRFDALYAGTATNRHNLKTGGQVPSDILAEVDRKIDDGNASQGTFRGTGANIVGAPVAAPAAACAGATWVTNPVANDCEGTTLF